MIHRAKFQNFKALRDVEVTFDSRLTVLVGPNGSGKTSVLQGIEQLGRLLAHNPPTNNAFAGLSLQDLWGSSETADLLLDGCERFNGEYRGIRLLGNRKQKTWPGIKHPAFSVWWLYASKHGREELFAHSSSYPTERVPSFVSLELLRLDPRTLAENTVTQNVPPKMDSNGRGLPSTLAYLKLYSETEFESVIREFRLLLPNVKRVRIDRVQAGSNVLGEGLLFDVTAKDGLRAYAMSDGTLYLLGLLTIIHSPHRPRLLLLDDLDHGLHPKAQMELVGVLRKLLAQFPDLQIIATSHSPYILNKLEWNEVRVTGLGDDGSAMCVRLEDHPEVEKWRDAMTPGEFWSHAGDDWVKKLAKPAPATPEPATAAP